MVIASGLGFQIWPLIFNSTPDVEHMCGLVWSVLGAVPLLELLGIRYPLQMLPLQLFELAWESIWVLTIGLPLWSTDQLTPVTSETLFACLMGIVPFLLVIP